MSDLLDMVTGRGVSGLGPGKPANHPSGLPNYKGGSLYRCKHCGEKSTWLHEMNCLDNQKDAKKDEKP